MRIYYKPRNKAHDKWKAIELKFILFGYELESLEADCKVKIVQLSDDANRKS